MCPPVSMFSEKLVNNLFYAQVMLICKADIQVYCENQIFIVVVLNEHSDNNNDVQCRLLDTSAIFKLNYKNTNCVGRYFYSTEKADFVHRAYHSF